MKLVVRVRLVSSAANLAGKLTRVPKHWWRSSNLVTEGTAPVDAITPVGKVTTAASADAAAAAGAASAGAVSFRHIRQFMTAVIWGWHGHWSWPAKERFGTDAVSRRLVRTVVHALIQLFRGSFAASRIWRRWAIHHTCGQSVSLCHRLSLRPHHVAHVTPRICR